MVEFSQIGVVVSLELGVVSVCVGYVISEEMVVVELSWDIGVVTVLSGNVGTDGVVD